MKDSIAIFSDIHGNYQALTSILNDINNKGIKKIYCLGDIISIGPCSRECLDLVMNSNIKTVLGNHEIYFTRGTKIDKKADHEQKDHNLWTASMLNKKHKEYLLKCPFKIDDTIGEYKLSFQHFLFKDNYEKKSYPFKPIKFVYQNDKEDILNKLDADITFIGHEHKAFKFKNNNKKLIDIGSSGCTKNNETFYTLVTLNGKNISIKRIILKYDRKAFINDFKSKKYPNQKEIGRIFFGL